MQTDWVLEGKWRRQSEKAYHGANASELAFMDNSCKWRWKVMNPNLIREKWKIWKQYISSGAPFLSSLQAGLQYGRLWKPLNLDWK